jgi:hypothetical protein
MLNDRPGNYSRIYDNPRYHGHYKGMGDITLPTPPDLSPSEWNPFSSLTDPKAIQAVLASDNPPSSVPFTAGNASYIIKDWLSNPWVLGGAILVVALLYFDRTRV